MHHLACNNTCSINKDSVCSSCECPFAPKSDAKTNNLAANNEWTFARTVYNVLLANLCRLTSGMSGANVTDHSHKSVQSVLTLVRASWHGRGR